MGTVTAPPPAAAAPPSSESSLDLHAGTRLGRYELVRRIATGGMAQVWVARQRGEFGFARTVAVKVIRPEYAKDASFRRMFLDEARLAARISHPNALHVLDLGEDRDVVFLAMELVEGATLAQLLAFDAAPADGLAPLPPGVVARIVADVAAGLHAAHELTDEQGAPLLLVHRDVSPQNILVSTEGVSKIADFGIAKAAGRLADETEAGQLKGKWSYLSPEQIAREPIDRRSDVFSLGIVMWEALTRRRLFRGVDVLDTVDRIARAPIPDPRSVVPSIPPRLARVALKALERDTARRFQSAAELRDAVEDATRDEGCAATSKQVGDVVSARAGRDVRERRAAVEQAVTELDATLDARGTEDAPRARRAVRRSAALGAIALAATVWLVAGRAARAPGARSEPLAAAASAPPAASSIAPPDPAPAPPAASSIAPSDPAPAPRAPEDLAAPKRAGDAKGHARGAPPPPRPASRPRVVPPSSSQRIPFTDPYR